MALELPALLVNGPDEVGLAAGADTCTDVKHALPVGGDSPGPVAFEWAIAFVAATAPPKHRAAFAIAAFLVAHKRWYDGDSNTRAATDEDAARVNEQTPDRIRECLGLISVPSVSLLALGTKVTWWQMNHHVGQGAYAGFSAKAARTVFAHDEVEDFKELHWIMGHWVTTRGVLRAFAPEGASGWDRIIRPQNIGNFPRPTRDITIRLQAGPAGTAKVMDTVAAYAKASCTLYAKLMQYPSDMAALAIAYNAIIADPVQHHIGASYLTGSPAVAIYQVAEDTLLQASAYLHGAAPQSTLAKNKSLPSTAEVASHPLYMTCVSLRASLTTRRVEGEDLKRITGEIVSEHGMTGNFLESLRSSLPRIEAAPASPAKVPNPKARRAAALKPSDAAFSAWFQRSYDGDVDDAAEVVLAAYEEYIAAGTA